jgi:prophage antirepressor-like protein
MKSISLTPMDFHGHNVGYFLDTEGNPWWHAQPVCAILGYDLTHVSQTMQRLDDDERRLFLIARASKMAAEQWCVTESGLYSFILGSHKSEAKLFKRWITHEVLPAIRKTGNYLLTPATLNAHFLGPQPLAIDPDHPKFALSFFQAVCQVFQ